MYAVRIQSIFMSSVSVLYGTLSIWCMLRQVEGWSTLYSILTLCNNCLIIKRLKESHERIIFCWTCWQQILKIVFLLNLPSSGMWQRVAWKYTSTPDTSSWRGVQLRIGRTAWPWLFFVEKAAAQPWGLLCNPVMKVKVNVKFSLEQAMKAQRGSRGIALLFL